MSGQDLPNAPSDARLLSRALPYMRPHWLLYGFAFLAAPISAVLVVAQPYLLKVVIDDAIIPGDVDAAKRYALMYLAAVVGGFALEVGYSMAMSYAALRTINALRRDVYEHTLSLSMSFFDKQPTGRLLTRATSDVEALGETLTAGAITIVLDVLLVLGILAAMFSLEPYMTVALLFLAPPILLMLEVIRRVLRRLYLEVRESLSELNAFIAERLTGYRIVQLYRDEARSQAEMERRLGRYREATVRTNIWDALLYATVDGVSSMAVALMLWYGSGGVAEDLISAGMLVAFIDYLGKLFGPIREFSQKVAIIQRAAAALEKIFGLLDLTEKITPGNPDQDDLSGAIVIDDLHFAYGPDGPDVLRGVSLRLDPGQVVAVVGRTGSGKTTLGKLLTRTYDGYRGSIRVGGVELSEAPAGPLRRTIGMVHQDVQLFPGTVRFNLTLGDPLGDDVISDAIDAVQAAEVVEGLGGLDGPVAHKGANLSIGEGQLLSFARTMAHDTPFVILDEATASVDTLTEARIQHATDVLLERKTVLVIAHRLSTIVGADQIVVMDAGRVIERGTHDQLMEAGGHYADLFRQQFHKDEVA